MAGTSGTLWQCPNCGERRRERLAKSVMHNCGVGTARKMTEFKRIEEPNE